jgi:myo-inositol-1(or 4)-monophosphatase
VIAIVFPFQGYVENLYECGGAYSTLHRGKEGKTNQPRTIYTLKVNPMNQTDWQQIFQEIKANVQAAIQPCLQNIGIPQPSLGMNAGGDLMKPVDLAAETAIVDTVTSHGVPFTLISEESGIKKYGPNPNDCYVTVDPIDGTTNLIHGIPFYATSVAVSSEPMLGSVYAGLVADLPRDVSYTAIKGVGAFYNGKKIIASQVPALEEALVGLDINSYNGKFVLENVYSIVKKTKHIRHYGANALEICYVAKGLTDAFIDLRSKIRTTDVAAGFLIAKEAGATVTDTTNQPIDVPLDPKQTLSFIASGNNQIHRQILSMVPANV